MALSCGQECYQKVARYYEDHEKLEYLIEAKSGSRGFSFLLGKQSARVFVVALGVLVFGLGRSLLWYQAPG